MNTIKLSALEPGQSGMIKSIEENPLKIRMMELGFTNNTQVTTLRKSPMGDPTAYLLKNSVITLRKKDAGYINVTQNGE